MADIDIRTDSTETTSNRFAEIVKSAKEHRYISGKLPRNTKMDLDTDLPYDKNKAADYGWNFFLDPTKQENMMFNSSVTHFMEKAVSNSDKPEVQDLVDTRFILVVPIKDSTDVMVADIQKQKGPPEDPRHKSSLKWTTLRTFVRLSKNDADDLLDI